MITIGTKNKILLFDFSTKGIDSQKLEFWFRIHCEAISYSFKGELVEDNKVKIVILPLTEMVSPRFLDFNKIYHANLEVIGDGKYSLTTWEGDIQLEAPPRIDVKLENVQEEIRKVVKEDIKKPKKIIKEKIEKKKEPAKIEAKMTEVIEESTEKEIPKVIPVKKPEPKKDTIDKHIEENKYSGELENIEYTRTSLLEDILGVSKKKPNVIMKINDLIKE